MIFINPRLLAIPASRLAILEDLLKDLNSKSDADKSQFIESNGARSWQHHEVLSALRAIVGNKCWYSEVPLEGSDPNVDHFRPKGRIREVNKDLKDTNATCNGYWWLAFEPSNYRLAAMHANQRRTDKDTNGGKWNYFPVRGSRAPEGASWEQITEDILALDPCSVTDAELLWFDSDGIPSAANLRGKAATPDELERVRATIWLYHLDKVEIQTRRTGHVLRLHKDLRVAHGYHRLWARYTITPNQQAKKSFDETVARIKDDISDRSSFARAKRCAVRNSIAKYPWIEEFVL